MIKDGNLMEYLKGFFKLLWHFAAFCVFLVIAFTMCNHKGN